MPLILDRTDVLGLYDFARSQEWVLPTFNSENLTTTEAILSATKEYGASLGVNDLPIIIGITNTYKDRPQSVYYSNTKRWDVGLKLFLSDLQILTEKGSPFEDLRVMVHLDHIIWDEDRDLLNWNMNRFSSIMYDASNLPLDQNIEKTAKFVAEQGDKIVIEGACDEIQKMNLTTVEMAERYYSETGVDIIVPNLGTEHRSEKSSLKYHNDLAKEISKKIGNVLCLHGSSSVLKRDLATLFEDGICKVNLWTALERESSTVLLEEMIKHASQIFGENRTREMISRELLGNKAEKSTPQSIEFFTTLYRQEIVFGKMKEMIIEYLRQWYS